MPTDRPLDIEIKREEVEKGHQSGSPAGNVGDGFRLNRMNEEEQGRPKCDVPRLFRDGTNKNPIDQADGAEMKQEIQRMIARRASSIGEAIDQKCGIEDRPDHMVEVADKYVPALQMRIFENCGKIVELEVAVPRTGIDRRCDRGRDCTQKPTVNGKSHVVVILH